MNTVNGKHKITLEEMRRTPIHDLIEMEMSTLIDLQKQADSAVVTAKRAQSWIEGAIAFKLYEQSKNDGRS